MSKFFLSSILFVTLLAGCKSSDDVATREVAATLDGYDVRVCACCGGQYLRINNDTVRYRFFDVPKPTGPPIDYGKVRRFWIRFVPYEGTCKQTAPELITITSIRERQ